MGRFELYVGRFGHPERPNRGRFGLATWAVFDISMGRIGFGPFYSFAVVTAATVFMLLSVGLSQSLSNVGQLVGGTSIPEM